MLCKEVKDETPIDHAINTLVDFNWLATCQERDYNDIKTESRRQKKTGEESVAKRVIKYIYLRVIFPKQISESR